MSAFIVNKKHIDALVTAGLDLIQYRPLRWLWPEVSEEDRELCYQRGQPWGPESVRLSQERTHQLTEQTAGHVGAMLLAENQLSVNHRYDEGEDEDPYVFERYRKPLSPVVVLKAIDCYEYQTCEHPDWEESEAHEFCQALRKCMIHRLPGYDQAPWGICE